MKSKNFLVPVLAVIILLFSYTIFRQPALSPTLSSLPVTNQTAQVASSLSNGLVGYWTFDDGTATDSSGNGNNGTINGATPVAGKFGQALSFNGSSQSVVIGNKYDAPGAFTLSAWVNPGTFPAGESFVGKFLASKGYRLDILKSSGASHVVLEIDSTTFTGSTVLQSGTWYLVTATYDGTNATLYVNGSVDASGASAPPSSNTANFQIGNGNNGSYSGIIDDVRMYSRALSSSEVTSLYTATGSGSAVPSTSQPAQQQTAPQAAQQTQQQTNQQTTQQTTQQTDQQQTNSPAAPVASGSSVAAASCSQPDVQAAVNSAVDGDTVTIPAGSCTWTASVVANNKLITIAGAGEDATTIIDNVPKNAQDGAAAQRITPELFLIGTKDGGVTRLTGMTLNGGTGIKDPYNTGEVVLNGTSKTWRIDHIHFILTRTSGVEIHGWTYGVVDHNYFDESVGGYGVYVFEDAWNNAAYGDGSWADSLHLGTDQAVFLEDNTFYASSVGNHAATDGWSGERIVIRRNTLVNTNISFHGTESSRNYRGARSFEIYDNTFQYTGLETNGVEIRSGNGVIFDNVLTGTLNQAFNPSVYREFAPFTPWGQCDGTSPFDVNGGVTYDSGTATGPSGFGANKTEIVLTSSNKTWTPNQWVGYSVHDPKTNTSGVIISSTADTLTTSGSFTFGDGTNYIFTVNQGDPFTITRASICLDQPGRGQGALMVRNASTGAPATPAWPNQIQEPIYAWNNSLNGVAGAATIVSHSPHILENRDFFNNYSMPGYTPYVYPHPLVQEEDGVGPTPISLNATTGAPPVYVPQTILPPAIPAQTPVPPTVLPVPLTPLTPQTPLIPTTPATPATPVTPITPAVTSAFSTPLKLGDTSPEVASLQQFLNTHGFYVSLTGIGSPGQETDYFGTLTQDAVIRFQNYYQLDVLTPLSLSRGTGYFGEETMGEVRGLLQ